MAHDAFWDRFFDSSEEAQARFIPLHEAVAAMKAVALGYFTLAQLKSYWNTNAGDNAALDAIAAHVGPMSTTAKMNWVHGFLSLVGLRERGYNLSNTVIETKLGL